MKSSSHPGISIFAQRLTLATLLTAASLLASPSWAVDGTWNGTSSNDYSLGANWSANVVPSPAGTSLFNNAGNGNTTLINTTSTINVIRFDTAAAAAYTLGTNTETITLDSNFAGGLIAMNATVVNNQVINSNLLLGNITATPGSPAASGTFTLSNLTAAGGPTLTLGGSIAGVTGTTSGAMLLALNGPGTGFLNGDISTGGATTFGVNVNSGNWTLAGNNSFAGPALTQDTIVYTRGILLSGSSTVLRIGSDSALGAGVLNITNNTATVQATNGDRSVNQSIVLGNNGFTFSGTDSLATSGKLVFGGGSTITNNVVAGKNLTIGGDVEIRNNAGSRTVTFGGTGLTNITGAIVNNNASLAISVTGSVAVTGNLRTTGTNTYSGTTVVNGGGTMIANGSHSTGSTYTVGAASGLTGTLSGTGIISPTNATATAVNILATGFLSPGDPSLALNLQTGTLDFGSSLTLGTGSTLVIQLGGANAGDGEGFYDQINVTNAARGLTVTGANLNVSLVNGFNPLATDVFYIATSAGTRTGTFAGLAEGASVLVGDYSATITYGANWTGTEGGSSLTGGNDIALTNFTLVPEPASWSLVLGAVMFLGFRRVRRR